MGGPREIRQAPTEPDIRLDEDCRSKALQEFIEEHRLPEPMAKLLSGVVHGHFDRELAAYVGISQDELHVLERAFSRRTLCTLHQAAARVLDAALTQHRESSAEIPIPALTDEGEIA